MLSTKEERVTNAIRHKADNKESMKTGWNFLKSVQKTPYKLYYLAIIIQGIGLSPHKQISYQAF